VKTFFAFPFGLLLSALALQAAFEKLAQNGATRTASS